MQTQIDNLQEEIQSDIIENVSNTTKANEIIEKVDTLGSLYDQKYVQEIRELKTEIKGFESKLDEKIKEAEEAIRHRKKMHDYMNDIFILRMYLNQEFRILWNTYENRIGNAISPEMICSLSRREQIYNDGGYKFTVYIICVIDKIPELRNFSVELCKFCVKINEKLHPITIPHAIVINAIRDLKNSSRTLQEYNVTDKLLEELWSMSNSHS